MFGDDGNSDCGPRGFNFGIFRTRSLHSIRKSQFILKFKVGGCGLGSRVLNWTRLVTGLEERAHFCIVAESSLFNSTSSRTIASRISFASRQGTKREINVDKHS